MRIDKRAYEGEAKRIVGSASRMDGHIEALHAAILLEDWGSAREAGVAVLMEASRAAACANALVVIEHYTPRTREPRPGEIDAHMAEQATLTEMEADDE